MTRFEGKIFTNFTVKDGLPHNQVWSILIDKSGKLWFGAAGGVSCLDSKKFSDFPIPDTNLARTPQAYSKTK